MLKRGKGHINCGLSRVKIRLDDVVEKSTVGLLQNEHIVCEDEPFLEHRKHGFEPFVHVEALGSGCGNVRFFDELDKLVGGLDLG